MKHVKEFFQFIGCVLLLVLVTGACSLFYAGLAGLLQ